MNKTPTWIMVYFGILEKVTVIFIVLKLLNVFPWSWIITLTPLWLALISGFFIGGYWFIIGLKDVMRNR